jgi:type II secretory pathway component PulM
MKSTPLYILIGILLAVITYLLFSRPPEPLPDTHQQTIDSLQVQIDSLRKEETEIREQLKTDSVDAAKAIAEKNIRIAGLKKRIQNANTIHDLPVPALDSLVRIMYGSDAI